MLNFLRQITAMATIPEFYFAFVFYIFKAEQYRVALEKARMSPMQIMFWHKPGLNQANVSMLNTVETIGISKFVDTGKYPSYIPWPTTEPEFKNPMARANFLSIKAPTKRLKTQDKKVVNQHEKPPELFYQINRRIGQRNSTVVLIGVGSGGDLIGAIPCLQSTIIALEPDKAQFPELVRRINTLYMPEVGNRDIEWLNGRVKFDNVEEVEEETVSCVSCNNPIKEDEEVALCSMCNEKVHLKQNGREFPCCLPKSSADDPTWCGEACKEDYNNQATADH